jgi:hypothetical protein
MKWGIWLPDTKAEKNQSLALDSNLRIKLGELHGFHLEVEVINKVESVHNLKIYS